MWFFSAHIWKCFAKSFFSLLVLFFLSPLLFFFFFIPVYSHFLFFWFLIFCLQLSIFYFFYFFIYFIEHREFACTVPDFPFDPTRGTHTVAMEGGEIYIDQQDFRIQDSEVSTYVILCVRTYVWYAYVWWEV